MPACRGRESITVHVPRALLCDRVSGAVQAALLILLLYDVSATEKEGKVYHNVRLDLCATNPPASRPPVFLPNGWEHVFLIPQYKIATAIM